MAIAGRSYANVPIIIRGSLEDPADFGSKTQVVVVTAQPDRRWFAPATVLTAVNPATQPATAGIPPPVVVAAPPDPRWFSTRTLITSNPPPGLATVAIPPPVVVAAQPDRRWLAVNPPSFAVGSPTAAPAVAQQGTAAVANVLAGTVTTSNVLAGSVTIVNDL